MIDTVLIAMAALAAGLVFVLFAVSRAPQGYQDEKGFHFGPEAPEPAHNYHDAVPKLNR